MEHTTEEAAMPTKFPAESHGSLPIGTVIPDGLSPAAGKGGVIVGRTYTAYKVAESVDATEGFRFVSFIAVHERAVIEPLVVMLGAR